MNPAGLTLGALGIWVLCQVFPGQALQRLNIISPSKGSSDSTGTQVGKALGGAAGGLVEKVIP